MFIRSRLLLLTLLGLVFATAFWGFFRPIPDNRPRKPVEQWSLGYWTPQAGKPIPPDQIEWQALTHIVYWAVLANPDGSLDINTQQLPKYGPALIQAAQAAHVKVLLGVSQPFWKGERSNLRSAPTEKLVTNISALVETMGFDGVDLDWEPFDNQDKLPAANLVAALRQQLGFKLLTATAIITDSAFWAPRTSQLDRLNVMTYDMTGPWMRYSWHNAALYGGGSGWSVDLAVTRFRNAGADLSKLSIGIPFFGYKISSPGITEPGQSWQGPATYQQIYYQKLASLIPSSPKWDTSAHAPYFNPQPGELYTYDNPASIEAKIAYAKQNHLGGWFVWEVGGDYLPNQTPQQPLLTKIKNSRQ